MRKKTKYVGFFILLFFALTISGVIIWIYSLIKFLPNPARINERSVIESTKIYDRTGKVILYELHGEERRTVIPLEEIPEQVRLTTIAAEDDRFYHHIGIDIFGIIRAALKNIARGDIQQGGSTITQQLIKNSILTGERTVTRKIKETILAILIEKKYSKDEILGLYLNQIPYGSNAYGIAAASQTFFGKSVTELTLAESSLLASLPKAPTYYSPYGSHRNELMTRKEWVLERLYKLGFAKKEVVDLAKTEKLVLNPPKRSIRAPHFIMFVREYLNEKYGEEFVEKGGLRVITTLDWKLQEEAEKIVADGAEKNEKLVGAKNAALTVIDPRSGDILVMVGSRDYFDIKNDGNVNVATRKRQPGSAFKPFVYATAFKKGYVPETILFDTPTEFSALCNPDGSPGPLTKDPKECYHPQNYDGTFRGPVTLRQAIAQSLNLPSVKLLYLAGVKDSIKTAQDLGITTLEDPQRYGLTLVLGGAEVTLLEMVSAFGVFAREGILHPKTSILRIETARGKILEEKKDYSMPVMDTQITRIMNSVLSDNNARIPVFSPQSSLYFPDRSVAAKTGTTQDFRDAWVIGYTPSVVAGVWVGNNDNTPMKQGGISIMVAGPIWHQFLETALKNLPAEEFIPPEYTLPQKPVLKGVFRQGPLVKIDKISKKLATEYTPKELIEEVGFGEVQSILATIKKDDPLGDPPSNPADDPQFKNWQEGIIEWLSKNPLPGEKAPIEFENLHSPEKQPKISILSPKENTAPSKLSEVTVEIKSSFPLREASLFIDDELINSRTFPIITEIIQFKIDEIIPSGEHLIKIAAFDSVGNKSFLEKIITISKDNN